MLAGAKLIAEAWDAAGESQLGKFPAWGRWAELNGWFRDDVRRFLRSEQGTAAAVAKRICGSLDLYGDTSRHPHHSVNFITSHDGFTLCDLVSYNEKHNDANGENSRDGWSECLSYNCGHEGPTTSTKINALRHRQMKNFLTLLFLSQGVPAIATRAMKSPARRRATTTPIARTTRSPGWIGAWRKRTPGCCASRA